MSSKGGGGRTDRKVSRDAREHGQQQVNKLRDELKDLKSTPKKTLDTHKAIDEKERSCGGLQAN
ncbi:MAG TPA: hypothetical protein VF911_12875 [Thermoanaerobaculia bacterium]|jgi:hypothetical protein